MSVTQSRLANAASLRSILRRMIALGLVLPPCTAACGKTVASPPPATDAATTPTTTAEPVPGTRSTTGPCRAIPGAEQRPCGWTVQLEGDLTTCQVEPSGAGTPELCRAVCATETTCWKGANDFVTCGHPCKGRRYDGLDEHGAPREIDDATYFARIAFFEAASVDAFDILARELRHHGAPSALVRACRRARADEVRHAKMAATLAKRRGANVVAPAMTTARAPASLEALAIENAVEGCAGETFGAALAAWQAEHAPTAELRGFFRRIAIDEARHAALAWRIDAWARAALDPAARERVADARSRAFEQLASTTGEKPLAGLGLPSAMESRRIARALSSLAA